MSDLSSLGTMAGDTGWEADRRPFLPNFVSDLLIAVLECVFVLPLMNF